MSRRLLVLRNVLKAWLLLAALSLLFGLLGWSFGGYRVAVLFAASVVLLASAVYAYADRIVMGMLGAREMVQGEAPALHSTLERLAALAGVVQPKLYVLAGQLSARALGRPRRRRRQRARTLRRPARASRRRRSSRGSSRTSSRTCATATSSSRRSR